MQNKVFYLSLDYIPSNIPSALGLRIIIRVSNTIRSVPVDIAIQKDITEGLIKLQLSLTYSLRFRLCNIIN